MLEFSSLLVLWRLYKGHIFYIAISTYSMLTYSHSYGCREFMCLRAKSFPEPLSPPPYPLAVTLPGLPFGLSFPSKLSGKPLLQKIPHALIIEHREIYLELSRKVSLLTSFHRDRKCHAGYWRRRHQQSYPELEWPVSQSTCACWYNTDKTAHGGSYHTLSIRFEAGSIGRYSCLIVYTWSKFMANKAIGYSTESVDVVLLNSHIINHLPFKYLCFIHRFVLPSTLVRETYCSAK